ncbi:MAG: TfoX/Sxy family protein [Pseudolabrys sp.]|nr:TfoX/Sxy family protein [Pseudolabrys sp.]
MDAEFIHELFGEFGTVQIKRMFSGQGIYANGVIFAIVSGDLIYLKTDDATRAAFEAEASKPLTFTKKNGQRMVTSYWRLPERFYDDPSELAQWARAAVGVARTKAAKKKVAKKPARKKTVKKVRKKKA